MKVGILLIYVLPTMFVAARNAPALRAEVITLEEREIAASFSRSLPGVLTSGKDVWGEAAMRRPGGPSYEFFADLLPPIRYCNAAFRHYPIVLSAPGSLAKARLVSNGSAVNAASGHERWKDVGFPVSFRVGGEAFGEDLDRLHGPWYERGYLPIVQTRYRSHGADYEEECFAATEPSLARSGALFAKFTLAAGRSGAVSAAVEAGGYAKLEDGALRDERGRGLVRVSKGWAWNAHDRTLSAPLRSGESVYLLIFTEPENAASAESDRGVLTGSYYEAQRDRCIKTWENLLGRAMQVRTPEMLVNDAWRALIVGTFMLVRDDLICYSAQNQYEKIYVHEGGDAVKSLLYWGYRDEPRRMIPPLMDFQRENLLFHQAGLKLQMLSTYYWLTHDREFLLKERDRWMLQINRIVNGREPETGLFPREKYCGDIDTLVYSLNSNSNSWRGLRDFAEVLRDLGDSALADRLAETSREFREAILAAAQESIRRDVDPPFVPIAMFGEEQPYEHLTESRIGGYYDLIAPNVLGSGVFGDDSEETGWMLGYLQQHGGICMGMIRCRPQNEMYTVKQGIDDLYSLRYALTLLRRDDVDRALVTFYGKLAQGMTRGTFIDGETAAIVPWDKYGRPTYMPPNSAANGFFLTLLRYMLVQDYDIDDDGRPETLRLLFGTPGRWLEDGRSIEVEHAPTAFGEVSVAARSHLGSGQIIAEIHAPPIPPKKMLVRIRPPAGWKVLSARTGGSDLPIDKRGTVDVSGMTGRFAVRFLVEREGGGH